MNKHVKKSYCTVSPLLTWRPFGLEPAIHCRSAVRFMNVGRFHVDEKNEEFSHRKLGNLNIVPYGQCNYEVVKYSEINIRYR